MSDCVRGERASSYGCFIIPGVQCGDESTPPRVRTARGGRNSRNFTQALDLWHSGANVYCSTAGSARFFGEFDFRFGDPSGERTAIRVRIVEAVQPTGTEFSSGNPWAGFADHPE